MKGLVEVIEQNRTRSLYKSIKKTAFVGFMVNIESLFIMFDEYVEKRKLISSICTFAFCQDFIEMLFGKIRSLGGFNDNPTQEQFIAACRKISVNREIQISKNGNCMPSNDETRPYSNILFVTSRMQKKNRNDLHEIPRNSDLEMLLNEVTQLEETQEGNAYESGNDRNISYMSHIIENKLIKADRKICPICSNIFKENEKCQQFPECPSVGTFTICKIADRFLKQELLMKVMNFNVFYYAICDEIKLDELFPATNFEHNEEHLLYIVRLILDAFIQIKCTHIARSLTLSQQEKILRLKLIKLIHFKGQ